MAYTFASASSQYLSATGSTIDPPLTMAAWLYRTGTGTRAVMSLNNTTNGNFLSMFFDNSNLNAFAFSGGTASATRALASANQWSHVAAVYSAFNSRLAYVDGTAGSENTTSVVTSGTNIIAVGSRYFGSSWGVFSNDRIGECGVWSAALTAAEVDSLAKGVSCRLIRPQSLVFYAPLIRDLVDVRGGLTITNNNTATVAVHPRVYA